MTLFRSPSAWSVERQAVLLLSGQVFFIGLADAMVYVVGNTIFLDRFGAEFVPYLYIVLGIAASSFFFGLAMLQRRWAVGPLSLAVFGGVGLILLLSWAALQRLDLAGASFVLMALFPLTQTMVHVLVGGQAGYLFHVRQMKRLYPLVFTSFAIGFILGSLVSPWLLAGVGDLSNLLLLGVATVLISLGFIVLTMRTFPEQLRQRPRPTTRVASKSFRQLLQSRYTTTLFSYQMLSAVGTQLVIYVFLTQAELYLPDPTALASFFGAFAGWRNVVSLLFLFFMAGPLLTRFGLRLGLTLNPLVVGLMVMSMIVFQLSSPSALSLFFWVTVLTYVLDNLLSDGITSTSIKTAYQVLPVADRTTVETVVEGIGVPAAFAFTGLCLLAFNALPNLALLSVLAFTLLVTAAWAAAAVAANRGYTRALIERLQRRTLEDVELTLADGSTLEVVQTFLQHDHPAHVRLALDLLTRAEHPALDAHLVTLLHRPDPVIQVEVLNRLAARRVASAVPAVEAHLRAAASPTVTAAALRTLCALEGDGAVEKVVPYLDHPEPEVRHGAMIGLLRDGGVGGGLAVGERLLALAQTDAADARVAAARIIGETQDPAFHEWLFPLLEDERAEVRWAALRATGLVKHPRLWPRVIETLDDPATRTAALEALLAGGEAALDPIAATLQNGGLDPQATGRLLRLCGQIKEPRAMDLLRQHLDAAHPDVQHQALTALVASGYRSTDEEAAWLERHLWAQVARGLQLLLACQAMGDEPATEMVRRALYGEQARTRQIIFLLLALHHDPRAMQRAAEHLSRGDARRHALALETLEVHLPRPQKRLVLPLLDESLPLAQRVQALGAQGDGADLDRPGWLRQMILDPVAWPDSWTCACAIYAATQLGIAELADWVAMLPNDAPQEVAEAADHALRRLALVSTRFPAPALGGDPVLLTIEKVAILHTIDIFADVVPDSILAAVARIVEEMFLDAGETFITEGELDACMYIVIEGEVRVHSQGQTIITLGPGKSVGELAVLDPELRSASVSAVGPVHLFRIDKEPFDEVMADRPEIAQGVIRALCERVRTQGRLMATRNTLQEASA